MVDQVTLKSIEITKISGLINPIMMLNYVDAIRINFMKIIRIFVDLKANPFLNRND